MNILILNKRSVKEYQPKDNSVLIRISSQIPFSNIKEENESKYLSVHKFGFEDIDYECSYSITREESLDLLKILLSNINIEEFVIHCDYGQSRSPAVGIAFSQILFGEDKFNIKENYPDYNRFVLDKLLLKYNLISEKIGSLNKEDILNYIIEQNVKGEL